MLSAAPILDRRALTRQAGCPRCDGPIWAAEEPSCLNCGWCGPTRAADRGERTRDPQTPTKVSRYA